jgi:hypothetical protein
MINIMKRILISISFTAMFIFSVTGTFAQETPYERRIDEIMEELLIRMGTSKEGLKFCIMSSFSGEQLLGSAFMLSLIEDECMKMKALVEQYCGIKVRNYGAICKWFQDEIKKADRLKTAEERAADERRRLKEQREKDRKEFERGDEGAINVSIRDHFKKWMQQGEFETANEYQKRLRNRSRTAFNGICDSIYKETIKQKVRYWCKDISYDANKEMFTVTFENSNYSGTKLQGFIKAPNSIARSFKDLWQDGKLKTSYYPSQMIFADKYLYPRAFKCTVSNGDEFDIAITQVYYVNDYYSSDQFKKVAVQFDMLDIDNEYLKGYTYNMTNDVPVKSTNVTSTYFSDKIEAERLERERLAQLEKERRKKHIDSFLAERETKFYPFSWDKKTAHTRKIEEAIKAVLPNSKSNLPEFKIIAKVSVDYNGKNQHDITITGLNNPELEAKLTGAIQAFSFAPEKKEEPYTHNIYPVNTQGSFQYNISATNHIIKVKKRHENTTFDGDYSLMIKNEMNRMMPYGGNYTLGISSMKINGTESIVGSNVLRYRDTGKPANALLSLLVPGWGVKGVTYGEKSGFSRTFFSYLLIGTGFGYKISSNVKYKQSEAPENSDNMEALRKKANAHNTASYIFAGLGATIWVYDIFWVYGKGLKNRSAHKSFKSGIGLYHHPELGVTGLTYSLNF